MIEVAEAISSFSHVQPGDQLITLTIGQLQDLISQAVAPLEARIDALEAHTASQNEHIAALEARQDQEYERFALDIARDRQRITKLENPEVIELCGKKTNDHLKQIIGILEGRKASGMRYLSFSDAADILQLSRRRIAQLGEIAASDPIVHIDVIWHPRIKNQKVFKLSGVKL